MYFQCRNSFGLWFEVQSLLMLFFFFRWLNLLDTVVFPLNSTGSTGILRMEPSKELPLPSSVLCHDPQFCVSRLPGTPTLCQYHLLLPPRSEPSTVTPELYVRLQMQTYVFPKKKKKNIVEKELSLWLTPNLYWLTPSKLTLSFCGSSDNVLHKVLLVECIES